VTGPQQQHDDPFGEARAQLVQGLAVLATVSEAAARWYAVGMQRRAEAQTQADRAAQVSALALEQAEQLAREAELAEDRTERQHVAQAFDDDWLDHADLTQTARLWRTANLRAAGGDEWAREGMQRAEQHLRQIQPNLMALYDRYRSEGHTPAQSMHAAAYAAWVQADNTTVGPQARAHPGRVPSYQALPGRVPNGRALGPGGQRLNDLDAAVRREVVALADGVDPQVLDQLQRQWREQGLLPPADAAELLAVYARELRDHGMPAAAADHLTTAARRAADGETAQASHLSGYAGQEHSAATQLGGTPDVPATAVDERRAGLDQSNTTDGAADLDDLRAAQAQRLSRTFPHLTVVQATTPHLAGKREAPIVATRQRGRAR
jgi:hypothetical protein